MPIQVIHGNSSPVLAGAAGAASGIQSFLDTKAVLDRMKREAEEFRQIKALRDQQIEALRIGNAGAEAENRYREEDRPTQRASADAALEGQRLANEGRQQSIDAHRRAIEQDAASAAMAAQMARQLGASRDEIQGLVEMAPEDRAAWLEQARAKRETESKRAETRRLLGVVMSPLQPQDDPDGKATEQFMATLEGLQSLATLDPEQGAAVARNMLAQRLAAERDQRIRAAKGESLMPLIAEMQGDDEAQGLIQEAMARTLYANAGFPETLDQDMIALNDAVARAEWLHFNTDSHMEQAFFDPMLGGEQPEDSPYYRAAKELRRAVRAGAITASDAAEMSTRIRMQMAEDRRRILEISAKASGRGVDPYEQVGDHPRFAFAPVDAQGNAAAYDPSAQDPGMVRAFDYWRGVAMDYYAEDNKGKRLAIDDPKTIKSALELMQTHGGWVIHTPTRDAAQKRLDALTAPRAPRRNTQFEDHPQ